MSELYNVYTCFGLGILSSIERFTENGSKCVLCREVFVLCPLLEVLAFVAFSFRGTILLE